MPDHSATPTSPQFADFVRGSAFVRYLVAIAAVVLACAARGALNPLWAATELPFIFFFPAIVLAAWYGRRGPALLAIVLSTLAAVWFFIEPTHSLRLEHPSQLVAVMAFVLSTLVLAGAIDLMHRSNDRFAKELRQRLEAETSLVAEKELLATTLTSIGDAVIVTDATGRVTSLNAEAERLTGWTNAEGSRKLLADVFRIINEQTREPVENPVDKVLRLGTVTGLANHTVLVARDGHETPIDDSAAPIRHRNGPILGVVLVFRDVTEQRRAQQESARLAAIVEFSGDAIFTKDLNGIVNSWNQSAQRLFGYKAEEIIGKSVTVLFPSDRLREEDEILARLRQGKPSERLETVRVSKDGRHIPVSLSVSPLRNATGDVTGASKIIHDITDLVAAREELMREKELLATTLASIGDGVILTDAQGRVTFLNTEAERLTGWSNNDAKEKPLHEVFQIINEQTRAIVENPVDKVMRFGGVVGLANHTLLVSKDGFEIPIDDSAAPIRQPGGPLFGIVLVFRDFTERKRAEAALREREERFHRMADGAPVLIWVSGTDKLCTWFNRQWLGFTGRTMEQEIGNGWAEGVHREEFDRCLKTYNDAFDARRPFAMEYRLRRHDGAWRWVLNHGVPIYETTEVFAGYIGSCIDITDQRNAADALRAKEAELEAIINRTPFMLTRCTSDLRYRFVSRTYAQMVGREPEDIAGKHIIDVIGKPEFETIRAYIERVLGGEQVEYESEVAFEGAVTRYLRVVYTPDRGPEAKVVGWIASIVDITDGKRAEEERERLLQSEQELRQLAEEANRVKDEFLAIMSHELRNPLNVILGYSELLVRNEEIAQSTQLQHMTEAIKRNAIAQSKLIRDLLDVSRLRSGKLELNKETISMMVAVNNAIDTVRADAEAKQITIEIHALDESLFVEGDAVRLEQIIWNLLNNSVKFTPSSGKVVVRLGKEKDQVFLTVEDTGPGIEASFLPHIFELFRQADASTSRVHSGLGIGLAVVKQLVDLHRGSITAHSAGLGKGATFTITLPLSLEIRRELEPVLDLTTTLEKFMVLVVDDSEDTIEMLAQVLKMSGAVVSSAMSGHEALRLMAEKEFDVILSDISMPGMDGFEFLRNVRKLPRGFDVPVLALTGFGRPEDIDRAKSEGFFSHVTKPFDLDALVDILQKIPRKQSSQS